MRQVPVGIGVNLFINLVAQIFLGFFVPTKPGVREMVDLNGPDFTVPVYVRSSVRITK